MDGEVIQKADPHVGLLHGGDGEARRSKPFNQSIGLHDRWITCMMCNEHAYVMAIEKLLGIEPPLRRAQVYPPCVPMRLTSNPAHRCGWGRSPRHRAAMTDFVLYCFARRRSDGCYEEGRGTRMHRTPTIGPGAAACTGLAEAMPKYQYRKWRSKKDVDRLNERRYGGCWTSSGFHQALSGLHRRVRTLIPITASGSSAR